MVAHLAPHWQRHRPERGPLRQGRPADPRGRPTLRPVRATSRCPSRPRSTSSRIGDKPDWVATRPALGHDRRAEPQARLALRPRHPADASTAASASSSRSSPPGRARQHRDLLHLRQRLLLRRAPHLPQQGLSLRGGAAGAAARPHPARLLGRRRAATARRPRSRRRSTTSTSPRPSSTSPAPPRAPPPATAAPSTAARCARCSTASAPTGRAAARCSTSSAATAPAARSRPSAASTTSTTPCAPSATSTSSSTA